MSTAKQQRTARFTTVGTISKTRGTGGELLIAHPETVVPGQLAGATVFLVPPQIRERPFVVEKASLTSEGLALKLAGVSSRADAFDYVGRSVVISSAVVPTSVSPVDEMAELIGYNVVDDHGVALGTLSAILETAAHAVLVIDGSFGEVLIPAIEEFVVDIDDDRSVVEVRIIPGMVPGYPEES